MDFSKTFFQDLHYFPRFPSIRRPLTIDEALMDSELENRWVSS